MQSPSSMTRASDGKMRVDTPNTSVITNPAANQAIVLNHVTKEAHVIPLPQAPGAPAMPGAPAVPGAPAAPGGSPLPGVHVQDLGKSTIDGIPVEGKRYTVPPPAAPPAPGTPSAPSAAAPAVPGAPAMPGAPKPPSLAAPAIPGAPAMPGSPGMPGAPKPPSAAAPGSPAAPGAPAAPNPSSAVCEVWTSTQFKTPVLTTGSTPAGVQTTKCKPAAAPEPDPSLFQVPPGYKLVTPKGS